MSRNRRTLLFVIKLKTPEGCRLVFTVLIALLALSACAPNQHVLWDDCFLARFHPSPAIMEQLEPNLQTVNQESGLGGITVRLSQTLGDERTLYSALYCTFPDKVPLQELLSAEGSSIMPESVELFGCSTDCDRLEGMDYQQLTGDPGVDKLDGYTTITSMEPDYKSNSISYTICFDGDRERSYDTVILVIRGFQLRCSEEERSLSQEDFIICWEQDTSNIEDKISFEIKNEIGVVIGNGSLSAFSLNVYLDASDFKSFDEMQHAIKIETNEGDTLTPLGNSTGSFASVNGAGSVKLIFKELLNLNDMKSVQIGGLCVDIR